MTHPSDLIAQKTFLGPDEIAFQKAQKRKRSPKVQLPKVLPGGPCCARCQNWIAPEESDDFGACTSLTVVTEKVSFGPERGSIFSTDQAMKQSDWAWESMATRGFFAGCSLFRSNGLEGAA
jgi:hypothetical protein